MMMHLQKVTVTDIPLIESWLRQPEISQYFGAPQEWIAELHEHLEREDWLFHFLVKYKNTPIGFCQFYEVAKAPEGVWTSAPEGSFGIDFLIGEKEFLKKGIGKLMLETLIQTIISHTAAKFIIADTEPSNSPAIVLLEKLNFQKKKNGLWVLPLFFD